MARVKVKWEETTSYEAVVDLPDDVPTGPEDGEAIANALGEALSEEDQPRVEGLTEESSEFDLNEWEKVE